MRRPGFHMPAKDISYRTIYNDVEVIKAYLRRLKPTSDIIINEELIRDMVSDYLSDYTVDVLSDKLGEFVLSLISPLRTTYVNDDFIDYIVSGIKSCDCTTDAIVTLISNKFMSIIDWNHDDFISYITSNVQCNITSTQFINIVTENKDSIMNYISDTVYNYISDDVLSLISPLRTAYVNDDFIDYIVSGIKSCDCTTDAMVTLISNKFMSIIEWNHDDFISYITSNVQCNITSTQFINIVTENKYSIMNYISDTVYNYISDDILSLIAESVQQELADQYPELDVKYLLRDYHLIDKESVKITSNLLTIPTKTLYNPASAFERFRLLACISSGAYTIEPLTDLNQTLSGNAYTFYDPLSLTTQATITTTGNSLSLFLTGLFNSHIDNGSVLWYGFTDLINPIADNNSPYAVVVSIDCSPNYIKLFNYDSDNKPTGYMTVSYSQRKAYNNAYATNVRNQFGKNIEVVEVVPHPLLINDSERYIVIRAITDSNKKGYWIYRGENDVANSYSYNKQFNRSVLKFSPLESPIIYANVKVGGSDTNVYYYQLSGTFKDKTEIYSIDLSNFVPFDNVLPENLTTNTVGEDITTFININAPADAKNFGKLQWPNGSSW